ncbi:MAG TPA: toll/interleukin-1 receptor domain-containing protein [Pyrinomonadaceae bacterium]|nr:toll/interleukin-1 receptor domain-containing protein [Pyrinomonadaceae bacterium]
MKYRVYISYSAKDSLLAEDLKRRLTDVGVEYAITKKATRAESVDTDYVQRRIREAINKSSEVIVLLTDNSVKNKWVLYEVGMADALERPVTFVMVNEGLERQLPIVGNHFIRYSDLPGYLSSLKKRSKAA